MDLTSKQAQLLEGLASFIEGWRASKNINYTGALSESDLVEFATEPVEVSFPKGKVDLSGCSKNIKFKEN